MKIGQVTPQTPDGFTRLFDSKKLKNCTLGHGNIKRETFNLMEFDQYLCVDDPKFILQGQAVSKIMKFVQATVQYCSQELLDEVFPG